MVVPRPVIGLDDELDELSMALDEAAAGRQAHSSDEFTRLREVILGNPLNARIPTSLDRSMWVNLYPHLAVDELATVRTGRFPSRIIEETIADLAVLTETLEGLGVTVHQAETVDHA